MNNKNTPERTEVNVENVGEKSVELHYGFNEIEIAKEALEERLESIRIGPEEVGVEETDEEWIKRIDEKEKVEGLLSKIDTEKGEGDSIEFNFQEGKQIVESLIFQNEKLESQIEESKKNIEQKIGNQELLEKLIKDRQSKIKKNKGICFSMAVRIADKGTSKLYVEQAEIDAGETGENIYIDNLEQRKKNLKDQKLFEKLQSQGRIINITIGMKEEIEQGKGEAKLKENLKKERESLMGTAEIMKDIRLLKEDEYKEIERLVNLSIEYSSEDTAKDLSRLLLEKGQRVQDKKNDLQEQGKKIRDDLEEKIVKRYWELDEQKIEEKAESEKIERVEIKELTEMARKFGENEIIRAYQNLPNKVFDRIFLKRIDDIKEGDIEGIIIRQISENEELMTKIIEDDRLYFLSEMGLKMQGERGFNELERSEKKLYLAIINERTNALIKDYDRVREENVEQANEIEKEISRLQEFRQTVAENIVGNEEFKKLLQEEPKKVFEKISGISNEKERKKELKRFKNRAMYTQLCRAFGLSEEEIQSERRVLEGETQRSVIRTERGTSSTEREQEDQEQKEEISLRDMIFNTKEGGEIFNNVRERLKRVTDPNERKKIILRELHKKKFVKKLESVFGYRGKEIRNIVWCSIYIFAALINRMIHLLDAAAENVKVKFPKLKKD